ncbi:GNAT family N-acetyltransferase [Emticicia fluvialis]|uniref:GNAT family N-acetyltransferase n=1 Tax=Emticicia fluvialis TaxID=2974474 RepID=UPI0021655706|nr:GNAT family N-acetyltransferase [Emticicia fluvialis]
MNIESFSLIRLVDTHDIKSFDCDDDDLNDFLFNDSKNYMNKLLAVTYILESDTDTVAFFSLANDKISLASIPERDKTTWNKFSKKIPNSKRTIMGYPAMKIGRLGVSSKYKSQGIGRGILDYLKEMFITNNRTGCRFITVDAYSQSLGFYEKNGFKFLTESDAGKDTRLMYFDLANLM